jgi:hypothetical protein
VGDVVESIWPQAAAAAIAATARSRRAHLALLAGISIPLLKPSGDRHSQY